MLVAFSNLAFTYSQSSISGTVIDETGEPLAGVNIVEKRHYERHRHRF